MRGAHPVAAIVIKVPGQNGGRASQPGLPGNDVGGEFFLHGLEQVAGEDRLMLAAIYLPPIMDLADVEPVLEQMGEWSNAETDTAPLLTLPALIDLRLDTPPVQLREQSTYGAQLQIEAKDCADRLRLFGHDFELFVDAAIAKRDGSADPQALALRGRNLVAHPLADDLALKLGKGKEHIEGEPAHAGGGVEGLGHRHEGHPMFIKELDQLG